MPYDSSNGYLALKHVGHSCLKQHHRHFKMNFPPTTEDAEGFSLEWKGSYHF